MLEIEMRGNVWMSGECKKYSVDLSAYFDGELEGKELAQMEAHLADCENCRSGLDKMTLLSSALSSISQSPIHRRSVLKDLRAKLKLGDEEDAGSDRLPS